MSFIKALLFLGALVASAMAAEELVREKKQVLLGAPLVRAIDDGSWFPGKYDPVAIHAAIPAALPAAIHAALPAAIPAGLQAYRSIIW